jgi:hypothetical protein
MKKARQEYFHRLLRDPATDQIPPAMRQRELAYARQLNNNRNVLKKTTANGILWKFAGPTDVGGRTRALAVDLKNSNILIAGGVSGGIWKSTDRGQTWQLKNSPLQPLSVTSVVQNPTNTDNWYYATGEFSGNSASDRGFTAWYFGTGLYKSNDNGESWQVLDATVDTWPTQWNTPSFDFISRIDVSPVSGTIFTANNGVGIMRSSDDGLSFQIVLGDTTPPRYSDVVITSDGTIVASLSQNAATGRKVNKPGIHKSIDDGITWTEVTPLDFPQNHDRTVLAVAPSNPGVVYALTLWVDRANGGKENLYLYKLNLLNSSAENRSENLPDFVTNLTLLNAQSGYNMVLGVKPDDENFVILGLTNLFRSRDGFATQPSFGDEADVWIGGYHDLFGIYPNNHPDHHIIVFDPDDPNKMWNGNDGGIYYVEDVTKSVSYPQTIGWIDKNQGYNVTQFYTAVISAEADDNRIMGGTQDNGTPYFTFDGSTNSNSTDVSQGDGAYCYFGDEYAYTSSQSGRLVRLGYTGTVPDYNKRSIITPTAADGQLFVNPFRVDPNDENVMYYPSGSEFFRINELNDLPDGLSNGLGRPWAIINQFSVESSVISAIEISQQPAHILYFAASNFADPPILYRTENATTSTNREEIILPEATAGGYVHDIAINPDNASAILVVLSNYNIPSLYYSSNSGETFSSIEGNLSGEQNFIGNYTYWTGPSIRSASILPTPDGTIYLVGSSTGLYGTRLLDGENTVWEQESTELIGSSVVEYVDSRKSDATIVVGTHGRGIFIGKYDPALTIAYQELINPDIFQLEQNYPNPFNPTTIIEFSLPNKGHVLLQVFDVTGKEITQLINKEMPAGAHKIVFDASQMASGVYFYLIKSGEYSATKKMMVLK